MTLGTRHRRFAAVATGIVLGTAPLWLNDASPLWPSRYSDEAQGVLEVLMGPGFLFSTLIGRGPYSYQIMVAFNILFFSMMSYFPGKPNTPPGG